MADEKKDDIYDEDDFEDEEDEDSVGLFTRIKEALNPRKIIKYILSNLWKPVIVSILLLSFFLASIYASAHFRLLNARNALDFESSMVKIRESENPVIRYTLPVIEWGSATLSAAGDMMQTRVDQIEQQREASLKEEEQKKQEGKTPDSKDSIDKQTDTSDNKDKTPPETKRPSQEELKKQKQEEAELQRIADERRAELNKRATKLANYYSSMAPKDAVEILKKMDDEEIIAIMNRMEDDAASQILAGFEPERASAISKKILKLQPIPLILDDKATKDVL